MEHIFFWNIHFPLMDTKLMVFFSGQVVDEIREAYDKELRLKRCVAENVAHCNDRETINLHKIAWVYQIYLPASVRFNVESLLAETSLVLHPQ